MKTLQFLIDTDGTLIWPLIVQDALATGQSSPPLTNAIVLTFYDDIETTTNPTTGSITDITPIDPVITGLSGTITVKARPSPNSPWLNITDGSLDISMDDVQLLANGLITGVQLTPALVTGCSYILCELTRGA